MILLIPAKAKDERAEDITFNLKHLSTEFKQIKEDSYVTKFVILIFLANVVYGLVYNLPSIYARNVLEVGAEGFGFIQTALSAGMFLGLV